MSKDQRKGDRHKRDENGKRQRAPDARKDDRHKRDENGKVIRKDTRKGDRHKRDDEGKLIRKHQGKSYRRPFPPEFIAIDGEGNDNAKGRHVYTLLCASDESVLERPQGLHTRKIFDWLFDLRERHPHSVIVGFALNYDINKWITDLPRNALENLAETNEARFWLGEQAYRLEWIPSKWFALSEREFDRESRKMVTTRHVRVMDVFGFFQARFVKVLADWHITDDKTVATIERMKQRRGDFAHERPADVRAYCLSECRLLVELMDAFGRALVTAGIRISSWHGAGAVANAILRQHEVANHLERGLPHPVMQAILSADFGGRIQLLKVGELRGVWQHDINSAYPSVHRRLPSWAGACIVPLAAFMDDPWTLYHVRWEVASENDPAAERILTPFPFRLDSGRIEFPLNGEGWYWYPEVKAALSIWPGKVKVLSGYRFIPANGERPYAFIDELYERRLEFKRAGSEAQIPIKLGMNSLYGKHAQATQREERPAPYQSYLNAGYITSATRARLLELAAVDPSAVIFFATDGVFATRQLTVNDPGKPLGGWEVERIGRLFVLQSGVYDFPQGQGKHKSKTRGFNPDRLSFDRLRALWRKYGLRWRGLPDLAEGHRRTFIGLKYAARTGHWHDWGQWPEVERSITPEFKGGAVDEINALEYATVIGLSTEQFFAMLPIRPNYQIVQFEGEEGLCSVPYEPAYTPLAEKRSEGDLLETMLARDNMDADNPGSGEED